MNNTFRTISKLVFLDSNNICVHYESNIHLGVSSISSYRENRYYRIEFVDENGNLLDPIYQNIQPKNAFRTIEYDGNNDPSNSPEIGYTYDSDRNAFIPPCPMEGYILDELTITWKPDPTRTYDLHNDGNLYRWDAESNTWTPTW